jgi:hypothetical protein
VGGEGAVAEDQQIVEVAAREVVRQALLDELINKIDDDPYPSNTMMDMVEEMLMPWDVERYTDVLLSKIKDERFPSIPMLARIRNLAGI